MKQILVSAIVSIIVLGLAYTYLQKNPGLIGAATPAAQESTYDRVMRTGEIRCGYSVWDPLFYIDSKTNEKKGIFHDMMEEVGARLGVKIIWQEELGWGTIVESVKTGRVDMACAGYWLNPARIKNVLSSAPQIYSPLYIWMRQDDTRVFSNPEDLNVPQYTVGVIDGGAENQLVLKLFAQAKKLNLPEMATNSDEIQSLTTGKIDFFIADASTMATYIANNPWKVKNAFPNHPLNVFPNVMLLPPGDLRLKDVIDNTLRNIEYDGTLDDILKNYHMEHTFLRNPPPVKLP